MACAAKLLGCCLHYNVAFVVVEKKDQVSSLPLQGEVIESVPDVVFALGRHYVSREFMAARGKNILKPNRFDCQELMFSSCKITKVLVHPQINFCKYRVLIITNQLILMLVRVIEFKSPIFLSYITISQEK